MTKSINVSTVLGTTFAWYDFLIFNIAIALVFPKLFFTDMGYLIPMLVFTVGFFARPVGSLVYGMFGDTIGRKHALVSTLYLTGISTVLIGLLPTYEQIGITATILLIILRITQTIAFGGEWAAASTLLTENNSKNPRRGFVTSLVTAGWAIAGIMAALSFMTVTKFGDAFFLDYGWRIPFLLSGILLLIGVHIRRQAAESPMFLELNKTKTEKKQPFRTLVTQYKQPLIIGSLTMMLPASWFYLISIFGVSFMISNELITRSEMTDIQFIMSWVFLAGLLFFGWIGDRIDQKKLFMMAAVFSIPLTFPILYWIANGHALLALGSLLLVMCPGFASAPRLFTSMFPTEIRTIGSGVTYNLGLLFAGLVPLVSQWILGNTGNMLIIGVMFLFLTLISFVAAMKIKKQYQ